MTEARARIERHLATVAAEENIRILFACESGSRAWGFPSTDSDYDLRFIYIHPTDWYLAVQPGRDVIERPLADNIDLAGWDIRKALLLFRKSNPPLLEWLGSPIVYREDGFLAGRLRDLARRHFSPIVCCYHYLHMAERNHGQFLQGPEVPLKKYLYVLRPVLAIQWLEQKAGPVPTEFGRLVAELPLAPELKAAIADLLEKKRAGVELGAGPRIAPISDFLDREIARLQEKTFEPNRVTIRLEALDDLFRQALREGT
ncbi:MAG: nucleotidyltransferase domain-containing protein [Planctomycetota bacterium]